MSAFISSVIFQETTPILHDSYATTVTDDLFRFNRLTNSLNKLPQLLLLKFAQVANGCKHGIRFKYYEITVNMMPDRHIYYGVFCFKELISAFNVFMISILVRSKSNWSASVLK